MELTKNLFSFKQIDDSTNINNSTLIFEDIRKKVEDHLVDESEDTDPKDRVFDFLSTLSRNICLTFEHKSQRT